MLTGCGAAPRPEEPSRSPETSSGASIPADGISLSDLGLSNGPLESFSLPKAAKVQTSVDQPTVITLVLSAPEATVIADYLRTALPAAGFTIDQDTADGDSSDSPALIFTGHGWTGTFTGAAETSAVAFKPS